MIRKAEQLARLDDRLGEVLQGKDQPKGAAERLAFAQLCQVYRKQYTAAARFYGEAFAAQPALADALAAGNRYNAACAAALAGCGQGQDAAGLDAQERARLRRQARDWLCADLDAWGKVLQKGPDQARAAAAGTLRDWQEDTDLAGVRGPGALAKLPEAERQAWRQLWTDVADTLARAREKGRPEGKKPSPAEAPRKD
jgi:serine/threonine-protein kinase